MQRRQLTKTMNVSAYKIIWCKHLSVSTRIFAPA